MEPNSTFNQKEVKGTPEVKPLGRRFSAGSFATRMIYGKDKAAECCFICLKNFSLLNNKRVCSDCGLSVCKLHSGNKPKTCQVHCDRCKTEHCRVELAESNRGVLESLRSQLEEITIDQDESCEQLAELARKCVVSYEKIASTTEIWQISISQLDRKVHQEREKQEEMNSELTGAKELYMGAKQREESIEAKYAGVAEELQLGRIDSERLITGTSSVQDEVTCTLRKLSDLLGLRELKKLLCLQCYNEVKLQIREILYPRRESPVLSHVKERTCSSCLVS